jgi:hypothetical protein
LLNRATSLDRATQEKEVNAKKRSLFKGIACTGLLLFSFAARQAAAQKHDDDAWHQTREGFFTGDNWRMHLFERVRVDLEHVQTEALPEPTSTE